MCNLEPRICCSCSRLKYAFVNLFQVFCKGLCDLQVIENISFQRKKGF